MPMSPARRTSIVFLCAFAYLAWLAASRFVFFMNDEGIYLDAAPSACCTAGNALQGFFSDCGAGNVRDGGRQLSRVRRYRHWRQDYRCCGISQPSAACLFWLVCKLSDSQREGKTGALAAAIASPVSAVCDAD